MIIIIMNDLTSFYLNDSQKNLQNGLKKILKNTLYVFMVKQV